MLDDLPPPEGVEVAARMMRDQPPLFQLVKKRFELFVIARCGLDALAAERCEPDRRHGPAMPRRPRIVARAVLVEEPEHVPEANALVARLLDHVKLQAED